MLKVLIKRQSIASRTDSQKREKGKEEREREEEREDNQKRHQGFE